MLSIICNEKKDSLNHNEKGCVLIPFIKKNQQNDNVILLYHQDRNYKHDWGHESCLI